MSAISDLVIHCIQQEDVTGTDDLDFYIDNNYIGRVTIGTGQTVHAKGPGMLFGDTIFCDVGQTITVYEYDLIDPSDLLLTHTVSSSDMDTTVTLANTGGNCTYSFEFTFVSF
jgi:hypothetical protein